MGNCFRTASQIVDPKDARFEHAPVGIPDYNKFQTSTIVTGKQGKAPGESCYPYGRGPDVLFALDGVTIYEATHHIFVVNYTYGRVEIFSETGEYICPLGVGQMTRPRGIAIHGDSIYVSCDSHVVSKFSLTDMSLVKKIGSYGQSREQFYQPEQITTDSIGRVFIADTYNNIICIYDTNLNHIRNITHKSMSRPYDLKLSRDHIYVLCPHNNPCILVLTLEGDKPHSFITCGKGKDVSYPFFFCLDPLNNLVISDFLNNSIRVFSPEGKLLHMIGREGHRQRMFSQPQGIAITPNGRLVCVLSDENYGLQIFC